MQRLMLCFALLFASPLLANSKTLIFNGVYAATYGDIGFDKGDWHNGNYSGLRLKAGFQLVRVDFVSLTVGFQKVGFYTATRKWDGERRERFDYRGPVGELHFFPDALLGFSFAAMLGDGYSYSNPKLSEAQKAALGCLSDCTVDAERSKVKVKEFTGYLTVKIGPGMQLFGGIGTRTVSGSPEYDLRVPAPKDVPFQNVRVKNNIAPDWKESNGILLFGLRGTTL